MARIFKCCFCLFMVSLLVTNPSLGRDLKRNAKSVDGSDGAKLESIFSGSSSSLGEKDFDLAAGLVVEIATASESNTVATTASQNSIAVSAASSTAAAYKTPHSHLSLPKNATVEEKLAFLANLETHQSIFQNAKVDDASSVPISWKQNEGNLVTSNMESRNLQRVTESVNRVLKFFEAHISDISTSDVGLALTWAKMYDDKHGGFFQKTYPLGQWITETCSALETDAKRELCHKLGKSLKLRSSPRHSQQLLVDTMKNMNTSEIGKEVDTIHGLTNGKCQAQLVLYCHVSKTCESKYFSPEPATQYMLTHQLLQRIFAESLDCPESKKYLDEMVNDQFCSKMYLEAQLVSYLNYPELLRDIFPEYVGFCGYMGYPNFFREDWLDSILSWQSESEYGCFVQEKGFDERYFSSDVPLKRKATPSELKTGVATEELCKRHFTAVTLKALMGYWDYLMDSQ